MAAPQEANKGQWTATRRIESMSESSDKTGGFVSFPEENKGAGNTGGSAKPAKSPEGKAADRRPKGGNPRMLVFVVVFLAVAGGLILGYRHVMDTKLNHAYLYSVARVTSWVLQPFTLESRVEPGPRYMGQEREIRAKLAAWDAEATAEAEAQGQPKPLTAFESFRYKTLLKEERYAELVEMIDSIESYQAPVVNSPEEEMEALRAAIDHLQSYVQARRGPVAMNEGSPGVYEGLRNLERRLNELAANAEASVEQRQAVLDDVWRRYEELRQKQYAHLQTEAAEAYERAVKSNGPLVSVVLRLAPAVRLQRLRQEIVRLEQDDSLEAGKKAQRLEALKEEEAEAQSELENLPRDSEARMPLAFTFTLVPDCGAIPAMSIFIAAIIAFPAGWLRKLAGLFIGLPFLYLVNVFRLATLGYIGAVDRGGELFDFSHNFVWQGIYIVFVVAIWLLWVEVLVKKPRHKTSA